jgi:alpha-2-macroglobulin-like protein
MKLRNRSFLKKSEASRWTITIQTTCLLVANPHLAGKHEPVEWFGRSPANICLTAYGVLEFTDMAGVHPVDEAVIERARKWLFAQQNRDGFWDKIRREWTWMGRGSITAFVAWALAESGDRSAGFDRALNYLRTHSSELANTYSRALAANAFLACYANDSFGRELASQLKDAGIAEHGQAVHWTSDGYSITGARGGGMNVETTALSAMALVKVGLWPQSAKQALTWLSANKSSCGTWGSTQGTILTMRALLIGSGASLGQDFDTAITVLVNGREVKSFHVNKGNSAVMKQVELAQHLHSGRNEIQLRQAILYLREISHEKPFEFTYCLRARYPLRVQSPPSTVYEYYQPTNRTRGKTVVLNATSRL